MATINNGDDGKFVRSLLNRTGLRKCAFDQPRAPNAYDDSSPEEITLSSGGTKTAPGYEVGSIWTHGATVYQCTSATPGAAIWVKIGPDESGITNSERNKLAGVELGAQKNVQADWDAAVGDALIKNKPPLFSGDYEDLTNKPPQFSGDYGDLSNRPTIGDLASIDLPVTPTGKVLNDDGTWGNVQGGGDMLAASYDPQAVGGDAFDMDNMTEGTDAKIMTAGERTKLGTVETGAQKNVQPDWNATSGDGQIANKPTLFSGDYGDLANKPVLFSGKYDDLTEKPVLFSGDYGDLTNVPPQFSGDYADLSNKPELFSKKYSDLTEKPVLFSGKYGDLTETPELFDGDYDKLSNQPALFSGKYGDLTEKPVLFSGDYDDLANKPSLFSGDYGALSNKPTLFSGDYGDLANKPTLGTVAAINLPGTPTGKVLDDSGAWVAVGEPQPDDIAVVTAPVISSNGSGIGAVVTATPGEYSGGVTDIARRWMGRDKGTGVWSVISGETGLTFAIKTAHVGIDMLRYEEHPTNATSDPGWVESNEIIVSVVITGPVWSIPATMNFSVGQQVNVNLSNYVTSSGSPAITIDSGSLPAGLILTSNHIEGVTTETATASVVFRATDAYGSAQSSVVAMTVVGESTPGLSEYYGTSSDPGSVYQHLDSYSVDGVGANEGAAEKLFNLANPNIYEFVKGSTYAPPAYADGVLMFGGATLTALTQSGGGVAGYGKHMFFRFRLASAAGANRIGTGSDSAWLVVDTSGGTLTVQIRTAADSRSSFIIPTDIPFDPAKFYTLEIRHGADMMQTLWIDGTQIQHVSNPYGAFSLTTIGSSKGAYTTPDALSHVITVATAEGYGASNLESAVLAAREYLRGPFVAPEAAPEPPVYDPGATTTVVSNNGETITIDSVVASGTTEDGTTWVQIPAAGAWVHSVSVTPRKSPAAETPDDGRFAGTAGTVDIDGNTLNLRFRQPNGFSRWSLAYDATETKTAEFLVRPGDTFLMSKCRTGVGGSNPGERTGVVSQYSGFIFTSAPVTASSFAPSLSRWVGASRAQVLSGFEAIDVGAFVDTLPSYDYTGMAYPSVADTLEYLDQYNPVISYYHQEVTRGGYETMFPSRSGNATFTHNYGRTPGYAYGTAALHLCGDVATRSQKIALATRLIAAGKWCWDVARKTDWTSKPSNGGHLIFRHYGVLTYLLASGRRNYLSQIKTTLPENVLSQPFVWDATTITWVAPHDSPLKPWTYRKRPVSGVSGNVLSFDLFTGESDKVNIKNLDIVRVSDGARVAIASRTDPVGRSFTATIAAHPDPAFSTADQVYFASDYAVNIGDAGWAIEGDQVLQGWSPSSEAAYLVQQQFEWNVMFWRMLGVWDSSFAPTEKLCVVGATANKYSSRNNFPRLYGDVDAPRLFGGDVWDAYAADLVPSLSGGASTTISAIIYGQSELERMMNYSATYNALSPKPTPGDGNVVMYNQISAGSPPTKTVVNATSVTAGNVNPAIAAMSAWLAHVAPTYTFHIGDGAVPGTGRRQLHNDDSKVDGALRLWSDFVSVVDMVESETGAPINLVLENWFVNDNGWMGDFVANFWPSYFGSNADGSSFTLGASNSGTGVTVDYCLWDAQVAADQKGRGIFSRDATKWRIALPFPNRIAPVSPPAENDNFTASAMQEPKRQALIDAADDTLAKTVDLTVGPSAHATRFQNDVHQDANSPDGAIGPMWPFAIQLARAAGVTIGEPLVTGITTAVDGSYADVEVSLPNGGTLTTLRKVRGLSMPATPSPHQQEITGIELIRGGTRRPVFRTSSVGYPTAFKGTVAIQDAGSGTPRKGLIRITPSEAFATGDKVSLLRQGASAMLQAERDVPNNLYLDMPIEHVPALYDDAATYPLEGIAVRPYQQELSVTVAPPAFSARSTKFSALSSPGLDNTSMSFAGSNEGTFSVWFKSTDSSWTSGRVIFDLRVGSTNIANMKTASSRRASFTIGSGTIYTTPTNTFDVGAWNHMLVSYKAGAGARYQIVINNGSVVNGTDLTSVTLGVDATLTRFYGGYPFEGDIAYFYHNVSESLDLSVLANIRKFITSDGKPVDLGADGSTPTGNQPAIYLDGGASMVNLGYAGSLTPNGLSLGSTPEL